MDLKGAVQRLRTILETTPSRLEAIGDAGSQTHAAGRWSKREILGHLIDSASNNHQRFVRAQLETEISFPAYAQNLWVETQGYQSENWSDLVQLWKGYNLHLLHLISHIPLEKMANTCAIGSGGPVTMEFLIKDYVRHLQHHLDRSSAEPDAASETGFRVSLAYFSRYFPRNMVTACQR
jgi:hypothetical protein